LYNTNTNTERYATSDMADASKTATVEQRAQKKAARRAAFIQDIAEAVYLLGMQRQNEIEAKQLSIQHATDEQSRLRKQLDEAALASSSPLEALYCKNVNVERRWRWAAHRIDLESFRAEEALKWSIEQGILPKGTLTLPDTERQFLAYATWKVSNGKAQSTQVRGSDGGCPSFRFLKSS
jgi:hypothetical protein